MTPYAVAFQRAVLVGLPKGVLITLPALYAGVSFKFAAIAGGISFCYDVLGRGGVEGYIDTRAQK
jgi:hypothetical protein